MYREGMGVDQNDIEALTHFIAAVEDGHMLGNYAVGLSFLLGRGSDVDAEAALFYLKEATLLGHALSPVEMGRVYFEGILIEKMLWRPIFGGQWHSTATRLALMNI